MLATNHLKGGMIVNLIAPTIIYPAIYLSLLADLDSASQLSNKIKIKFIFFKHRWFTHSIYFAILFSDIIYLIFNKLNLIWTSDLIFQVNIIITILFLIRFFLKSLPNFIKFFINQIFIWWTLIVLFYLYFKTKDLYLIILLNIYIHIFFDYFTKTGIDPLLINYKVNSIFSFSTWWKIESIIGFVLNLIIMFLLIYQYDNLNFLNNKLYIYFYLFNVIFVLFIFNLSYKNIKKIIINTFINFIILFFIFIISIWLFILSQKYNINQYVLYWIIFMYFICLLYLFKKLTFFNFDYFIILLYFIIPIIHHVCS